MIETPTDATPTPEMTAVPIVATAIAEATVGAENVTPIAVSATPAAGATAPTLRAACALIPTGDAEEILGGIAEIIPPPPAFQHAQNVDICLLRYVPPGGGKDHGWLLTLNVYFSGGGTWYKAAKQSEALGGKLETGSSIGDDYFYDLDNVSLFARQGDAAFSLTTGEPSGNRGPSRTKELRVLATRVVARLRH